MKYRARANGEVRTLRPSEVAALVPWLYEPIEEAEDERRDAAVLTPDAPLETTAIMHGKRRRR